MKNILKYILILSILLIGSNISAQELMCNVQINSSQVQGSDKSVFDAMQKSIFEFVNSQKWTNNVYKSNERIECTIMINVTEQKSTNEFSGTIQIQARRPVFNTSFYTPTFNHIDKEFDFRFNEFDPLEYTDNTFTSNLTSVIAFYANIIIGLDYDSFAEKGGTKYFKKARTIVANAQGAQQSGWKAFENDRNRYWLAENLNHNDYKELRVCFYQYHRLGFDAMAKNVETGRATVLKALKMLEPVYTRKPGNFQLQIFFNAKSKEIVELFSKGLVKEKNEVANLLNKIDPNNLTKYEEITKGK
ncbi:MAG: DUF4835 family protein [Vicingaceae bacterium]